MSNVRNVLSVSNTGDLLDILRYQRSWIETCIMDAYISALRDDHSSCVRIGNWYYIHLPDSVQFIGSNKRTRHVMFHSRVVSQIVNYHFPF